MILIPVLSPYPAKSGIATGTDVLPSIPNLGDALALNRQELVGC